MTHSAGDGAFVLPHRLIRQGPDEQDVIISAWLNRFFGTEIHNNCDIMIVSEVIAHKFDLCNRQVDKTTT